MDIITVFLFVVCYATVQSVFGVGLLLFGTPTLLLLGYPFAQALGYLLPCSILVNTLQFTSAWKSVTLRKDFVFYCLPFVVLGLVVTTVLNHSINIKAVVGVLLLVTAVIRSFENLRVRLEQIFKRFSKPSLVTIGIVHGLSNMGGGLLTVFISSIYKEKQTLRANIAYGYFLMACCQCVVLLFTAPTVFNQWVPLLMLTAGGTYLLIGNRIFNFASGVVYQRALTTFIVVFGLLLLK